MDFLSYAAEHWRSVYFALVPVAIFSVRPSAPEWVRGGRILFLVALFEGLSGYFSTAPEEAPYWNDPGFYFYASQGIKFLWGLAIINTYVGWWELVWRCFYRQLSWKIKENFSYGLVSTLSVAASAAVMGIVLFVFLFAQAYFTFAHGG